MNAHSPAHPAPPAPSAFGRGALRGVLYYGLLVAGLLLWRTGSVHLLGFALGFVIAAVQVGGLHLSAWLINDPRPGRMGQAYALGFIKFVGMLALGLLIFWLRPTLTGLLLGLGSVGGALLGGTLAYLWARPRRAMANYLAQDKES